jgi:hypothetical protein
VARSATELDAEIAEVLSAKKWEDYLALVPHLDFGPVSSQTWASIRAEGLDQEHGEPNRSQWTAAELPISRVDADGLRRFDAATVEKFNGFDIALKRAYGGSVIDLVDYDRGTVSLVAARRRR